MNADVAGQRFGRYEGLIQLASGGMGTVCVARLMGPRGFKRLVAIKTIHSHLACNEEYVKMLSREADLASRIDHPNVVPVLELGDEAGQLFLVMEYYPSVPLTTLVRALKSADLKMSLGHAIGFAMEAAAGLEAAHNLVDDQGASLGIVHRDVTPSNLLVGPDGTVKVTDFGIAKAHTATMEALTVDDHVIKGKPAYLSPEQAMSATLDRRSDVFALGIVLYELVTSRRLFEGANEIALLHSILDNPIPSPRESRDDCPEALAAVIGKALQRDVGKRYQSAAEFRDALQDVARDLSASGRAAFVDRLVGTTLAENRRAIAQAESVIDTSRRTPGGGEQAAPGPRTQRDHTKRDDEALTTPSGHRSRDARRAADPVAAAASKTPEGLREQTSMTVVTTRDGPGMRVSRSAVLTLAALATLLLVGVLAVSRGTFRAATRPSAVSRGVAPLADSTTTPTRSAVLPPPVSPDAATPVATGTAPVPDIDASVVQRRGAAGERDPTLPISPSGAGAGTTSHGAHRVRPPGRPPSRRRDALEM